MRSTTIDWEAVGSKVSKSLSSFAKKNEIQPQAIVEALNGDSPDVPDSKLPEEAGEAFKQVLVNKIYEKAAQGYYTPYAASRISSFNVSAPVPVGGNKFEVTVSSAGDMSRRSLRPRQYGGIDELDMLLNEGVDHPMRQVKGKWHGRYVKSKTDIEGAGFYEDAINDFMSSFAKAYGVVNISFEGDD